MVKEYTDEEEEKIDDEFSDLIREKLTDNQFWEYVSSWKDGDDVAEQMEEWDTETKEEAIKEIKNRYKIK